MRQGDLPHLDPLEKGLMFAPDYETELIEFDVRPAEWTHVCSARFGDGRPCGFSSKDTTKWSGDSYRYDIFTREDQMALRWWNGGGQGWLIAARKDRRSETCLLSMIAEMHVEARRWDACHFIWEAAHKSAAAGELGGETRIYEAFLEGRLKKRRRNGAVHVEIIPKIARKA